jgi:uncharacterized alkaline shock family protein YloU
MALNPADDRLPCGVELDALVAQLADDAAPADPAHEARCPYCQTALAALRRSWGDLHMLAREPVPVPPGLTRRIMTRVGHLAARTAHSFILATVHGHTRISHAVIAQVARRAALAVPGVHFASALPAAGEPAYPTRLGIAIRLVIAFGSPVEPIADAVRASVRRRVPRLTGAEITTVDILVMDITGPGP